MNDEPEIEIEIDDDDSEERPPAKSLWHAAKDALLGLSTIQLWTTTDFYEFQDDAGGMTEALSAAKECFETHPGAVLVRLVFPMSASPAKTLAEAAPMCIQGDESAVMSHVSEDGRYALVHIVAKPPKVASGVLN